MGILKESAFFNFLMDEEPKIPIMSRLYGTVNHTLEFISLFYTRDGASTTNAACQSLKIFCAKNGSLNFVYFIIE